MQGQPSAPGAAESPPSSVVHSDLFYVAPTRQFAHCPKGLHGRLAATTASLARLRHSAASLLFWTQGHNASSVSSDVEVWLHLTPESRGGPPAEWLRSFELIARSRLRLSCPEAADVLLPGSVAVLSEDTVNATLSVTHACAGSHSVRVEERVYRWDTAQLHFRKRRVLLTVSGTAPPYAAHVVAESKAGLLVLESRHHTHMFRVRVGAAVRDGVLPPVAEVTAPWAVVEEASDDDALPLRGVRHMCVLDGVAGLVAHDAARHRSTFLLAALPAAVPRESTQPQPARVLLSVATAALQDADDALVAACGLAQRLTYGACRVVPVERHLSPLVAYSRVEMEARVEGAAADGAGANVTWRLCGLQRYETAVRAVQRPSGDVEWAVRPLRRVLSVPAAGADDSWRALLGVEGFSGVPATPARNAMQQQFAVACSPSRRSLWLLPFFHKPLTGAEDCVVVLPPSLHHAATVPLNDGGDSWLLSSSSRCRGMGQMWWQPAPPAVSVWVCARTRYSVEDWCLAFLFSFFVVLLCRVVLRWRLTQRLLDMFTG